MATSSAETAVRTYLTALKDPSTLRDDDEIAALERRLQQTDDPLERVVLQQKLIDAKSPSIDKHEEAFVEHAKGWAEETGVTAAAFTSEGVPSTVLRRAGFQVRGGRGRGARKAAGGGRNRVSADEVRKAIPRGTFTVKRVEEATGASTAVVRKVIQEEIEAGNVSEVGPDPDHTGPGRAPTLYRK